MSAEATARHSDHQQPTSSDQMPTTDANTNNNNNKSTSPKPHLSETAGAGTTAASAAADISVSGGNKPAAGDISSCLQSSLEQMQQRFQEMVDLILSKLDDMNGQIEELEKILLETMQRSGQQQNEA